MLVVVPAINLFNCHEIADWREHTPDKKSSGAPAGSFSPWSLSVLYCQAGTSLAGVVAIQPALVVTWREEIVIMELCTQALQI